MKRLRGRISWLGAAGAAGFVGACFGGSFLVGTPCESDYDCGPALDCVDGICRGVDLTEGPCGDGIVNQGEDCDDGNEDDSDACIDCVAATCGDGHIWVGQEECDDANDEDGDLCTNSCNGAVCGDGIQGPNESCDDGNDNDTDQCTNSCETTTCGDGVIDTYDPCDDGNNDNHDGCTNSCTVANCGDGFPQAVNQESCDDGNLDEGDSCTSACEWATCEDGERNTPPVDSEIDIPESDVDCGGPCTTRPCAAERTCVVNTDCSSGDCGMGGICVPNYGLAAGGAHTCVLNDGRAWCWGEGDMGQLGYGSPDSIGDDELPSASIDLVSVGQVVAGETHTCALMHVEGDVRCWGEGASGRLGQGTISSSVDDEPKDRVSVSLDGRAIWLAAGRAHTCAILESRRVQCWGLGDSGRLGYGDEASIGDDETPLGHLVEFVEGGSQPIATSITAGKEHTCAILDDQFIRCWGSNESGQLGYGAALDPSIGVSVGDSPGELVEVPNVDLGGLVPVQIEAGWEHTCALVSNGELYCWGANDVGQLGYPGVGALDAPSDTPVNEGWGDGQGWDVAQVAAFFNSTCALSTEGKVRCWGEGGEGQLGYGGTGDIDDPSDAADLALEGVEGLAVGSEHVCARLDLGRIRCWGSARWGQLGYGNTDSIRDAAVAGDVAYLP